MSALLVVVLDVEGSDGRRAAGIGATEVVAAVLRRGMPEARVEVVTRAGRLAELLESPSDLVVLHDPRRPIGDPEPVLRVIREWYEDGECVAAVGCTEVTDTLKHVDGEGRVLATLDRGDFCTVIGPLVVTHAALCASLAVAPQAGEDLGVLVAMLDRLVGVRRVVSQRPDTEPIGYDPAGARTDELDVTSSGGPEPAGARPRRGRPGR